MSILDYKILSWIQSVSSLQDQPNQPPASMTAAQLKAAFDSNSNQLRDALNNLIDYLNPSIDGPQALFVAEYGTTTSAEIEAAYQAGKLVVVKRSDLYGILCHRITSTDHKFTVVEENRYFVIRCANDVWTSSSANVLAPVNSPAFTGTPTAPTPTAGDNSTKIATTAFVKEAIDDAGGAGTFIVKYGTTTYAELEQAWQAKRVMLFQDAHHVALENTYVMRISSTRFRFVSIIYHLSNTPYLYIAENNNNTWSHTTTSDLAYLSSPAFTGTPTAPTPTAGDDSTKIATTAFVKKAIDDAGGGAPAITVNLNDLKNGTQQMINEFCSDLAEAIDGGTMPVICGTRDNLSYNYYNLGNVIRDSGTDEITQINYSSVTTGSSGGTVTFVESSGITMSLGSNDDWSFSEGTATLWE